MDQQLIRANEIDAVVNEEGKKELGKVNDAGQA